MLAGCKLDEVSIPSTTPTVVVQSVLNPANGTQVMYLERTLTGTITVQDSAFNPNDPIRTGGGIPITGASAQLVDSDGTVTNAVEQKTTGNAGTGVYLFPLARGLRFGARYDLRVRTLEGETVSASTRIPTPLTTSTNALTRTFNRDHDTLLVTWNRAIQARTYAIRIESPFGPFFMFTDSAFFRLTGDTRNIFSSDLRRVLIPGFRQDALVAAVDSNFYDYYRTNNDPFTGSGIISRITGGIGLFGSIVSVTTGTLNVVADQRDTVEGRYRATAGATDGTRPSTFQLYIESKSTKDGVPTTLSGRYTTGGTAARSDGVIGTLLGSHIELAFLANQLATDTVEVLVGTVSDGVISGNYVRRPAVVSFTKS